MCTKMLVKTSHMVNPQTKNMEDDTAAVGETEKLSGKVNGHRKELRRSSIFTDHMCTHHFVIVLLFSKWPLWVFSNIFPVALIDPILKTPKCRWL